MNFMICVNYYCVRARFLFLSTGSVESLTVESTVVSREDIRAHFLYFIDCDQYLFTFAGNSVELSQLFDGVRECLKVLLCHVHDLLPSALFIAAQDARRLATRMVIFVFCQVPTVVARLGFATVDSAARQMAV